MKGCRIYLGNWGALTVMLVRHRLPVLTGLNLHAFKMKILLSPGWVTGLLAQGPGNSIPEGDGHGDAGAAAALCGGISVSTLSAASYGSLTQSRKGITTIWLMGLYRSGSVLSQDQCLSPSPGCMSSVCVSLMDRQFYLTSPRLKACTEEI